MGKADVHIHTLFSDGLMSPEALIEFVVFETDLDVIAVTDHDTIAGALVAKAYTEHFASIFRLLEVIIGAEITSSDGDILALFIESDIPSEKSAAETVELIHQQGGIAIAAHPFSHTPALLRMDGMKGVQHLIETVPFDGIEVRNATPTEWLSNRITRYYNRRGQQLSETGGSDGHYLPTIGKAHTCFPGHTAEDLRQALLSGKTSAGGHVYSPFLITRLVRELLTRQLPAHRLPNERSTWPLMTSAQIN
jgi:predicted metal-dependent phosphoesterase TrpH